ncbi:CDP-alcohol phosphatidyltransferase family protein [Ichthyenterobacterium sp. W332]|uniref:CDP-alcohol phosphatidyltransferase family protein n=1 Tax=Microcosmobacter mediterraneus TaxID=3075607 RepID=A0ABU2YGV0_9FLAO|nr:CDP-alcohol phosphatidyltransferase family protein [Ichthyenterobacterium sp. W332]MDT0557371.1 CDP-alcohol phosphatidyltransferase family protein [Ichthyenterobacterium sp. W332]
MIKHIPNLVTLLNLFCGCIATIFAVYNNFVAAALFVSLGIFFDFFDGFLARILKAQSPLGLQLDSLADMVTSGVVPGIVMFKLISMTVDAPSFASHNDTWNSFINWQGFKLSVFPLLGFFITLASAYRLAKFNIDEDQQDYFKGLPVPANTLLILSFPLILEFQNSTLITKLMMSTPFLLILTLVSCYLLNSNIKLFALKFKSWDFKSNIEKYGLIITSIVLLISFKFIAIPIIILLYIMISLIKNFTNK